MKVLPLPPNIKPLSFNNLFDKKVYRIWAIRMKLYLQALDLWDAIIYESVVFLKEEQARHIIVSHLTDEAVGDLSHELGDLDLRNPKEIWDFIEIKFK